jgi:hypothetical protein
MKNIANKKSNIKKHLMCLIAITLSLKSYSSGIDPSQIADCLVVYSDSSTLMINYKQLETAKEIDNIRSRTLYSANRYYGRQQIEVAIKEAARVDSEVDEKTVASKIKDCAQKSKDLFVLLEEKEKAALLGNSSNEKTASAPITKTPAQLKAEKIELEKKEKEALKAEVEKNKREEAERKATEKAMAIELKRQEAMKIAEEKALAIELKKQEALKIAQEKAEKLKLANAPKDCKADYLKCLNVTMLIKNYNGISRARKDCENRTGDLAKWQYRFNGSSTFNGYYDSEYEMKKIRDDKIIRLTEDEVFFQNGFGAWKSQGVVCFYDLEKSRAIYVNPQ